jgi:phage shock protein E
MSKQAGAALPARRVHRRKGPDRRRDVLMLERLADNRRMRARIVRLLLGAVVLLAPSCSRSTAPDQSASPAPASPEKADTGAERAVEEVAQGSARLLDVRTPAEWAEGHAEGALHFELARIQAGELPPLPREDLIYAYCRTGKRAGQAIEILERAGFGKLVNIGGLSDWQTAGGPVEKGAQAAGPAQRGRD